MVSKKTPNPLLSTFCNNGHHFPALWQYMLPEEFAYLHVPAERRLDCASCNRVQTDGYRKETKCCTYFPQIPNFMVGLALKDPRSRALAIRVIEQGHVLPEGTLQTPDGVRLFADEYARDRFGTSTLLRCPFLEGADGECGIYPFRSAVCASFFCQYDHGDAGDRYWEDFQSLVRQAEVAVYQRAMTEAGIDALAYNERLDSLVDRLAEITDPQTGSWASWVREFLYGEYFGNEIAFFESCADFVTENRNELFNIASSYKTTMAFTYEKALENGLTAQQLREIQYLPETMGEPIPVGDLWYKLQLATRRLWELPFNEGKVKLNPAAVICDNPGDDTMSRLHQNLPYVVTLSRSGASESRRVFLSVEEAALLRMFVVPTILGEASFEKKEIAHFAGARDFLAECLRTSILIMSSE